MSQIKIFSTQRIDLESDIFDSKYIIPVRCGAVFDKKESTIIGDNTGDNISHKRDSYCELTTQYWVWKNMKADYFGFFHYRRYLSFCDEKLDCDKWGTVIQGYIDDNAAKKLCIYDNVIKKRIENYDMIVPDAIDLSKLGVKTVYEHYKEFKQVDIKDLDCIMEIISEKYPEYNKAVQKYIFGNKAIFCNIFIMKTELFQEYSKWMFDILFEFEKRTDMSNYSKEGLRTPGHLGERLLGIYYTYLLLNNNHKIGNLQLVVFANPEKEKKIETVFSKNCVPIVFSCSDTFAPYSSVMIQSIINHSDENRNYDIVILEKHISELRKDFLKKMSDGKANISIRFFNVDRYMYDFDFKSSEHFTVETYFRLLIPEVFPAYDKILYLDGDMVTKVDVAKLFDIDIGDNMIGAVNDPVTAGFYNGFDDKYIKYCKEKLEIKDPFKQFNAGVLIMDLKKFRKKFTVKFLIEFAEEGQYKYCDQDVLNIICYEKIHFLDCRWNVQISDMADHKKYVCGFAPKEIFENYTDSLKDPWIIHYAGSTKPWHNPNSYEGDEFWSVAAQTPFYDIIQHNLYSDIALITVSKLYAKGNFFARIFKKFKSLGYKIGNIVLPKGTKPRKLLRNIYCKLRGWE